MVFGPAGLARSGVDADCGFGLFSFGLADAILGLRDDLGLGDDFFDVVARQYLGGGVRVRSVERRTETRDKNQKCHSQIKLSLMTWHLIHTLEFQCE